MLRPTHVAPLAERYGAPGGPWDVPDLDALLDQRLEAAAAGPLLVDDHVRLDAAAVAAAVGHLAGGLARAGVGPGDVVAWQLPNRHEAVLLARATWRLGAVAAPIHHGAGAADVASICDAVDPRVRVAAPDAPLAAAPGAIGLASPAWQELLDADPRPRPSTPAVAPSAPAAVLWTAGSSGTPKGVLHSRRALAAKATTMVGVHALTTDDVVLMPAPLAHVSGLLNGVLVPGAVPLRTVLMARWDPERALSLVEAEAVTFMVGPPTFFVGLVRADGFSPERVASLRLVSCGGAGVTEAFVRSAAVDLGAVVKRTYGSTEAPTVATAHAGDDPERAARHDGRAVGAAELRVVDPATGSAVVPGTPGELLVRGPELCDGYLDAARTAEAFVDGWFRTGDLATLDADGWLTVVGRLKDVVIRGGENISTSEVEAVLEAHPGVHQAVAVGYPDDLLGERVCAFVVADTGFDLEACRTWFAERGVARFTTPEQVVRVEALPTLGAGKPDRAALRADAARRFGPPAAGAAQPSDS